MYFPKIGSCNLFLGLFLALAFPGPWSLGLSWAFAGPFPDPSSALGFGLWAAMGLPGFGPLARTLVRLRFPALSYLDCFSLDF